MQKEFGVGARSRGMRRWFVVCLLGLLALLTGCSGVSTMGKVARATATSVVTSTSAAAGTPTPMAGICNAADFPPPIRQGPPLSGGDPGPFYGAPVTEFAFPAGTYYYDLGHVTGQQYWHVCSPGDPPAIAAFMRQSITASGWTILPAQNLSFGAEKPTSPPTPGVTTPVYCRTLGVTVGGFPGYPGEWTFGLFAPVSACV